MTNASSDAPLDALAACFTGLIPTALATASADGLPNVTYLSRVHPVDGERIALSNQFMSKSHRNLVENPRASLLMMHPVNHDEFRLDVVYERTERRGPVFDRLRNDLAMIAALTGMADVFRLQAADIYRVEHIEQMVVNDLVALPVPIEQLAGPGPLGELCVRISRCADLDSLVAVTVDGLASLLGYDHAQLLLVDETGSRLFTIASHGYAHEGIGAEIDVGEGLIGMAAQQCAPVLVSSLVQMDKYAQAVRRTFAASGAEEPGRAVPWPGLVRPNSQLAVPALALGQLVGILFVESEEKARFSHADMATLSVVASLVAGTVETLRSEVRTAGAIAAVGGAPPRAEPTALLHVRHFRQDGSTFLDGDYLIKGVAGRLLWSLLRQHQSEQRSEFTNREVRLDPSLDLPDFRDNFESRLILLKRRLDEREALVRIEKTGRGRFRLVVDASLRLETMGGM